MPTSCPTAGSEDRLFLSGQKSHIWRGNPQSSSLLGAGACGLAAARLTETAESIGHSTRRDHSGPCAPHLSQRTAAQRVLVARHIQHTNGLPEAAAGGGAATVCCRSRSTRSRLTGPGAKRVRGCRALTFPNRRAQKSSASSSNQCGSLESLDARVVRNAEARAATCEESFCKLAQLGAVVPARLHGRMAPSVSDSNTQSAA